MDIQHKLLIDIFIGIILFWLLVRSSLDIKIIIFLITLWIIINVLFVLE